MRIEILRLRLACGKSVAFPSSWENKEESEALCNYHILYITFVPFLVDVGLLERRDCDRQPSFIPWIVKGHPDS